MSAARIQKRTRFVTVSQPEFFKRVNATMARTAFDGGPEFKLAALRTADGRVEWSLVDGATALKTFIDGPAPFALGRARVGVISEAEALEFFGTYFDQIVRDIWTAIGEGKPLTASDTAFLRHWTNSRTHARSSNISNTDQAAGATAIVAAHPNCFVLDLDDWSPFNRIPIVAWLIGPERQAVPAIPCDMPKRWAIEVGPSTFIDPAGRRFVTRKELEQ